MIHIDSDNSYMPSKMIHLDILTVSQHFTLIRGRKFIKNNNKKSIIYITNTVLPL